MKAVFQNRIRLTSLEEQARYFAAQGPLSRSAGELEILLQRWKLLEGPLQAADCLAPQAAQLFTHSP